MAVDFFPASPGRLVIGHELAAWLNTPEVRARYRVGLVIWRRQYASKRTGWRFVPYHGPDPHDSHVHVSVGGCI